MTKHGNDVARIEEIEVGTLVLAYNEETGEKGYREVARLFRNETKKWYRVKVNGEEIICTGEHPFYVIGKGFKTAHELNINEKLLTSEGKYVIIEKIETEELAEAERTYNFEVEGYHTYYVSEIKVLVHNACEREIFENSDAAYNAAKKDLGINFNDKPLETKITYYNDGTGYFSPQTTDIFSNGQAIVHHPRGHVFSNGDILMPHYNAGKISNNAKGFLGNGRHYFYRR